MFTEICTNSINPDVFGVEFDPEDKMVQRIQSEIIPRVDSWLIMMNDIFYWILNNISSLRDFVMVRR